nr:PREDICTED: uncharacterized protein LOC105668844 [Linepithema humile]
MLVKEIIRILSWILLLGIVMQNIHTQNKTYDENIYSRHTQKTTSNSINTDEKVDTKKGIYIIFVFVMSSFVGIAVIWCMKRYTIRRQPEIREHENGQPRGVIFEANNEENENDEEIIHVCG